MEGIGSDLAMHNPLAMMKNFETLSGADSKVEEGLQGHWSIRFEVIPDSLKLISDFTSFIPRWPMIDDPRKIIWPWVFEDADNDRCLVSRLSS
jgi:hypothetical protein